MRRLQHGVGGAGVQPGDAAAQAFNFEAPALQIGAVDLRDLQFAPGRGLDGLGDLHDLRVVKVDAGDGVAAARAPGLLLNGHRAFGAVEGDHAEVLGVAHRIGEDGGPLRLGGGLPQAAGQPGAVEDVVAEYQRRRPAGDELLRQDEGFGQTLGLRLHGVLHGQPPAAAVAEHLLEAADVLGR